MKVLFWFVGRSTFFSRFSMYTAPLLEQSRMDIIFVFFVFSEALFLIMGVQADNQPRSDFKISDLCNVKLWDKLRIVRPRDYGNCILKI